MAPEDNELAIPVNDENWQSVVIDSEVPVLVEFGADWNCECRQLDLMLEEIADEHWGQLKVVRVDVDESPRLAAEFSVKSLPTLLVMLDGYEEDRMDGVVPKAEIEDRALAFLSVA